MQLPRSNGSTPPISNPRNSVGRQVRGIERSTFVVDRSGKLAKEWRGVKVPGHAQAVLDFVKTLG